MEIGKLYLLQMGHQWKTKERILPTSNLANQWVYYHCLQQHEWLSGNIITKTAHPSTAMTQGRYIPGALMHTHTHYPHPLLSYSTKERISSPASFVHCLHNYGERSWKACIFFLFCFLSLLISMSFQNPVNSLSFLNLTLLSPLYRREWLSWVEIITQKDFNLMASVLIKGRNQKHHTHTHMCAHAHAH